MRGLEITLMTIVLRAHSNFGASVKTQVVSTVLDILIAEVMRSKHRPSTIHRLPACPFRFPRNGEKCLHYAFPSGGLVSLFTHIRAPYNRQQTLGQPSATSGRPLPLSLSLSLSLLPSFRSRLGSLRFSTPLSFYPFICPPPPRDSRDRDSLLIPRG